MHFIVDIETLGKTADSALLSIGCVALGKTQVADQFFEVFISVESAMEYGRVDPTTMQWWMLQGDEAKRKAFTGKAYTIEALKRFADWMNSMCPAEEAEVWGYGSDFDNANLLHKYHAASVTPGWTYRGNRCLRTVAVLHPFIKEVPAAEIEHDALSDAKRQAAMLRKYLEWGANV